MNPVRAAFVLACAIAYAVEMVNSQQQAAQQMLGSPRITAYTQDLANIELASKTLQNYIILEKPYFPPNDPHVHYLMILNAINHVVDNRVTGTVDSDYYDTVNNAIMETTKNPQVAADKVRAQLYRTLSNISTIKDLIVQMQTNGECGNKISYECDLIIDIAVRSSSDSLLKEQARFFTELATEANLFLRNYAGEFERVSQAKTAPAYLINGEAHLEPLLEAAVITRKNGNVTPPEVHRRYGGVYYTN